MSKKIPYGVKVRVRGKSGIGYKAELCINYSRFSPFNIWTEISSRKSGWTTYVFDTLKDAQEAAMSQYDSWIAYKKHDEEKKQKLKKVPNGTVWEHP